MTSPSLLPSFAALRLPRWSHLVRFCCRLCLCCQLRPSSILPSLSDVCRPLPDPCSDFYARPCPISANSCSRPMLDICSAPALRRLISLPGPSLFVCLFVCLLGSCPAPVCLFVCLFVCSAPAFRRPISLSLESRTRFGGATYNPLFIYLLINLMMTKPKSLFLPSIPYLRNAIKSSCIRPNYNQTTKVVLIIM